MQLEAALAPYDQTKNELAAARVLFRELTDGFIERLKTRCESMSCDEKRAVVLELLARDVQTGLDAAISEKRQELVQFVEKVWEKYRVTLTVLYHERVCTDAALHRTLKTLNYS